MPICKCALCGGPKSWEWEEAFYHDGFDDGINSQTEVVEAVLADAGYEVTTNDSEAARYIDSIKTRDGIEQIACHTWRGESDPRGFLPDNIIKLLDAATFGQAPAITAAVVPAPFLIDAASSTGKQLFVDIPELCSISIKREKEGVVVDIYRPGGEGCAVSSATGWNEDLTDEKDEVQPSLRFNAGASS